MTSDGISFVIDNKPYDCATDHINFDDIMEAVKEDRWDDIPGLISVKATLSNYCSDSGIEVHDDHITFGGKRIHGTIVDRILTMVQQGFNIDPIVKFLENLYNNPSHTAINELYDFLVSAKMPITEDGCFLAYKRVRDDYTSCHDGKTDNSIGSQPSMNRFEVNDDRTNTCSAGLHFCSHAYLKDFSGARTVILKINPADVVSIPSDYDNTKGRAWTYYVQGEVDNNEVAKRNLLGESKSVVKSSADVPESMNNVSEAYILGYDAGFRWARYNKDDRLNIYEPETDDWDMFFEGEEAGQIDGKKRKPRRFAAPV